MRDEEVTSPSPLNFDKRWTSLVILIETVPISGPMCSGVDTVLKRKFADTIGNRTMVLELVFDQGDVRGYVPILQGILLYISGIAIH